MNLTPQAHSQNPREQHEMRALFLEKRAAQLKILWSTAAGLFKHTYRSLFECACSRERVI